MSLWKLPNDFKFCVAWNHFKFCKVYLCVFKSHQSHTEYILLTLKIQNTVNLAFVQRNERARSASWRFCARALTCTSRGCFGGYYRCGRAFSAFRKLSSKPAGLALGMALPSWNNKEGWRARKPFCSLCSSRKKTASLIKVPALEIINSMIGLLNIREIRC